MSPLRILPVLIFSFTLPARAVVTAGTTGNTAPPDADPVWGNVGELNGSTAIYLGNGYVITAAHVGVGSVTLGGVSYDPVPGSAVTLNNNGAVGMSELTDLRVFRIDGDPGLAPVRISESPLKAGSEVTLIGNGKDRAGAMTYGSVISGQWRQTDEPGNANGFALLNSNSMRWGTNEIARDPAFVHMGTVSVHTYQTYFDSDGGIFEAQAVLNDSGGGMFYNRDGVWELAGVIVGLSWHSGQPYPGLVAFGNRTITANLSYYRNQLEPLLAEVPGGGGLDLPGDPRGHAPEPAAVVLLSGAALLALKRRRL